MRFILVVALAICAMAARADGPALVPDANVAWRDTWKDFGGWSGLSVSQDGMRFLAISDRGSWARGSFERRDGRLTGVRMEERGHLHAVNGDRLKNADVDAEGLAVDSRGRAYVSFEANSRVRRYDDIDGPATTVPSDPAFGRLQTNSGLEALAIDGEGSLYAIPERSGALSRPFPVYRLRDGHWDRPFRVRRDGTFLVSDADFGPDGKLYVLERDFRWLGGFATRVRRFTVTPDGLAEEATLLRTAFGELDNMEGISVWRDPEGQIRVTLISDDNFFPLQRTMFAEYVLAEG